MLQFLLFVVQGRTASEILFLVDGTQKLCFKPPPRGVDSHQQIARDVILGLLHVFLTNTPQPPFSSFDLQFKFPGLLFRGTTEKITFPNTSDH